MNANPTPREGEIDGIELIASLLAPLWIIAQGCAGRIGSQMEQKLIACLLNQSFRWMIVWGQIFRIKVLRDG